MKVEKSLTIVYSIFGVVMGVLSNYLNLIFALSIPLVAYSISLTLLVKFIKSRKIKWLISNSFVTFILVWLLVWIILYNFGG